MNILIPYFSGTGCTELAANTIADEFISRAHKASCIKIKDNTLVSDDADILIVCFAVHACNAPEPVIKWAKKLQDGKRKPAVIISVSGGGEITPNLASRLPLKTILTKKNYEVVYEKMLVMPSNMLAETKPSLSAHLIKILPHKVSFIVDEILQGKKRLTNPPLGDRLLTFFGAVEHQGAHLFGKFIHASDSCNGCSLCAKQCPVGNITMVDGRPVFGSKCTMCLSCIYGCPQKALIPKFGKSALFKEGFSLKKILNLPVDNTLDFEKEARGYGWLGLKNYLQDTSDCLEPAVKKL